MSDQHDSFMRSELGSYLRSPLGCKVRDIRSTHIDPPFGTAVYLLYRIGTSDPHPARFLRIDPATFLTTASSGWPVPGWSPTAPPGEYFGNTHEDEYVLGNAVQYLITASPLGVYTRTPEYRTGFPVPPHFNNPNYGAWTPVRKWGVNLSGPQFIYAAGPGQFNIVSGPGTVDHTWFGGDCVSAIHGNQGVTMTRTWPGVAPVGVGVFDDPEHYLTNRFSPFEFADGHSLIHYAYATKPSYPPSEFYTSIPFPTGTTGTYTLTSSHIYRIDWPSSNLSITRYARGSGAFDAGYGVYRPPVGGAIRSCGGSGPLLAVHTFQFRETPTQYPVYIVNMELRDVRFGHNNSIQQDEAARIFEGALPSGIGIY